MNIDQFVGRCQAKRFGDLAGSCFCLIAQRGKAEFARETKQQLMLGVVFRRNFIRRDQRMG